ncbi:hypothetical protein ABMA28_003358 [Loxostege sticticalis]|uniref:Ankyrin repeat and sterile alpha motif domain-containing protein 1B n=1 Tax=Loxostege sticticalis TaxID=481309 RepID=A0ABD0SVU1_LOXSC
MGRGQELLDAARNGERRTVEKILGQITKRSGPFTSLRRGAGVNVQDDNGYTPLHHACLNGHKEIVRMLLSVDASPCIADKRGATPLHLAAWKGESNIVAMLLAHKNPPVNVDQLTQDHETALLSAAHFGYTDVVAQLIAKGADVTIRNIRDESALDLAAQYGRLEVVQHLLRVMPQLVDPYKPPKCRTKLFSSTPLHRASKNGRKEVVQVLLAAGIDPNIRTHNGTPLHEAACFRKASVVRILLANGADLNATDRRGMTVHDLLADYSEEATRKVRRVIREFENHSRITYESEEELPPFPVQDYSPTSYPLPNIVKAPETQEKTNKIKSFVSPSSSSQLTKHQSQSFVKKLASKCLGLKAKFNSAPNISNNSAQESEDVVKSKHSENKHSTNTLLIGNSKFFKKLSKKEETGEIVCTDEFDTISLDRLSTLNRDSTVNRSNRSCPGFKTSLPNISENNEHSDSQESVAESVVMTEIDCDKNKEAISEVNEAVNYNAYNIAMKPHSIEKKRISVTSNDSANLVNECYEAYEFAEEETIPGRDSIPRPPPRPNMTVRSTNSESETIYENVTACSKITRPTPAARTHIPTKMPVVAAEKNVLYENVSLIKEKNTPEPPKRTLYPTLSEIGSESISTRSRSSTLSSDSLIDETNLEDILLSQKSKSFRHSKLTEDFLKMSKSNISRTSSNSSDSSNFTETSAIENVDCSGDANEKSIYLSMTGTMPHKKNTTTKEKKVLFRHKTFTNIEVDRNSVKLKALPFFKETLAHYHIRGTGHCIYSGPTLSEFIYVFNRDTLYKDVPPFTKVPNDRRDSYFETAICFCRPKPPKFHSSAEDLLDAQPQEEKESVFIDMDALKRNREMKSTSFRCFCDSNDCTFHSDKRDTGNLVVKFSAIKKSISTPDITLNYSPSSTVRNVGLIKNKSVPSNLEEPYAVVTLEHIVARQKNAQNKNTDLNSPEYVSMSPSTFSSNSSNRPYSLKDISDVISLTSSTTTSQTRASDSNHLPLRKSSSSEHSGHWSLQSCNSNVTIKSDASFVTCFEESEEESDSEHTLHSDEEISDTETVKSEISTAKRPWVHSDSFRFGNAKFEPDVITEEKDSSDSKFESGISVDDSDSSSSEGGDDSGVPRVDADVSLVASLERGCGVGAGVRSGSGRRRWDEAEGTSEGDALSVSSAASSCAPLHLAHHHEYSKVSPTPPKKPPRRNLSVSPTHANSPSSGYSYELRPHARSQDDLDDIQGAKHYLKHGRSVDQYVDGKLSYSEYEDNHNSPRLAPVPNPRPSLKNRSQPVAITAMYENVVIKEQNPRRKLRRNNFGPQYENYEPRMNDNRVRKHSNQEKSSLESLLDDQSMNSPSDCERYYDGPRVEIPLSPSHYEQPPTPEHPPPSAKQAENSIHERIRPLSQLIMEVVEEIRIRKKSQGDIVNS